MVTWPTLKIVLTWKFENMCFHISKHVLSDIRYRKTCDLTSHFVLGVGGGLLIWNLMNLFWKNKFCFLLGLVTKTNPRLTEDKRTNPFFPTQCQRKEIDTCLVLCHLFKITHNGQMYTRRHIPRSRIVGRRRPSIRSPSPSHYLQGHRAHERNVELMENMSIGRISKTESIPKMWSTTKHLKSANIVPLQNGTLS